MSEEMSKGDWFGAGFVAGCLTGALMATLIWAAMGIPAHAQCWDAQQHPVVPNAVYRTTGGAFSSCQVEISPGIWVGPNTLREETP